MRATDVSPHRVTARTEVQFGVCLTHHSRETPPHLLAAEAEARGFGMFFVPENSHVPLQRPGTLRHYHDMRQLAGFYDSFTALGACAAVTSSILLGTSVCLLTQRDPILTARSVASLDQISGGRVILGVAGGFIREAMENHGSPFRDRWSIVRDRVHTMRKIWSQESPAPAAASADVVSLPDPVRPRQAGGPPIWIGSNSDKVPARVADYADGWMARPSLYPGSVITDLKRACARRGRDVATVTAALMDAPVDPHAGINALEQGFNHLIYFVRDTTYDTAVRRLDAIHEVVERINRRQGAGSLPST